MASITSPFVQMKNASLKILNERKALKNTPSELLESIDLEGDETNRTEMLINHKFIEAYTEEYKYLTGFQKPNYLRGTNFYDGLVEDGIYKEDLYEIVQQGLILFKAGQLPTTTTEKNSILNTLLGLPDQVETVDAGDKYNKFLVWYNDHEIDSIETDEFKVKPEKHYPYNSWQTGNEELYDACPIPSEIEYINAVQFLISILDTGKKSLVTNKQIYLTPYREITPLRRHRLYQQDVLNDESLTTTERIGNSNITEEGYLNFHSHYLSENSAQVGISSSGDTLALNSFNTINTDILRDDLFDKHRVTVTAAATKSGKIRIGRIDISVLKDKETTELASTIYSALLVSSLNTNFDFRLVNSSIYATAKTPNTVYAVDKFKCEPLETGMTFSLSPNITTKDKTVIETAHSGDMELVIIKDRKIYVPPENLTTLEEIAQDLETVSNRASSMGKALVSAPVIAVRVIGGAIGSFLKKLF